MFVGLFPKLLYNIRHVVVEKYLYRNRNKILMAVFGKTLSENVVKRKYVYYTTRNISEN